MAENVWEGPYAGVFLGNTRGEDRVLSSGAGAFSGTSGSGPEGLGTCFNTSSNNVNGVAGQTTLEDCELKGQGNPPHVWLANSTDSSIKNLVSNITSSDSSRFLGGVKIGYNWQTNSYVYGIEADLSHLKEKTLRSSSTASDGVREISVSANGDLGLDWLGTIRARSGYAFSDILPYVTAGYAFGSIDGRSNLTYSDSEFGRTERSIGDKSTQSGWVAGLGLDYRIKSNILAGLSYLYVDLGSKKTESDIYATPVESSNARSAAISSSVDPSFHMFRVGLTYLF